MAQMAGRIVWQIEATKREESTTNHSIVFSFDDEQEKSEQRMNPLKWIKKER